ncbi:preprotein translocase subunit SecE [Deltaproteobacteria bacterium PRO3]|nr:preprotein translocase subunit SecE [Deltaproteobacteria bacterium PRO3]
MDRYKKYIDLGLGLAAVAVGFLLYQFLLQIWDLFRLPLMENLPLSLPALVALVVALGLFLFFRSNAKSYNFLGEVATELSKVTWPTRQETVASTGVIIVMVGIASLIMFGFDALWGTLTARLLTL